MNYSFSNGIFLYKCDLDNSTLTVQNLNPPPPPPPPHTGQKRENEIYTSE